jgi:hypothetical protein
MARTVADRWIEDVYTAGSRSELADLYDVWAATYDTDMQGIGYIHPAVIAGLRTFTPQARVLSWPTSMTCGRPLTTPTCKA